MAKSLDLFYHFYICDDERGLFWNWWLDEQAKAMKEAGMPPSVPIHLYATMPRYYNSVYDVPIYKNGTKDQTILDDKFKEYVHRFYPFLKIEDIRDTGQQNIFEGHTLQALWNHSRMCPDRIVGYIHTKGVMSVGPHSSQWRNLLNYYFITEWRERYIELLEDPYLDVVIVRDKQCDGTIASGNFFYAKTNYIAKLEEPNYGSDRYAYEKWILSGDPMIHIVTDTNKDHFLEY